MYSVETIWLGIVIFTATNIDDVFILLAFFADARVRTAHIVLGQLLGIAALIALSGLGAFASLLIPPAYIGLMGLLPIALGVKQLLGRDDADDDDEARGAAGVAAIAAITIANGGDNIAVYVPVFATRTPLECIAMSAVFLLMTLAWLGGAHWLVNHPQFGAPIRRYGRVATPIVLIALGVLIIIETDAWQVLLPR